MKAITLRHPWPFAIINLGKRIENRTWEPSLAIGEKFAIHGGKFPVQPDGVCKGAANQEYFLEIWDTVKDLKDEGLTDGVLKISISMLLRNVGICAVATYGGTVRTSDSPWFCGPVGWVITDLIVLPEAVPCRGAQGLWTVPDDVLEKMRAQFAPEICKVSGCAAEVWPTFDGVCFDHGMFPESFQQMPKGTP